MKEGIKVDRVPQQYQFIIELGIALHDYGLPSYKIQNYLRGISKTLEVRGSFMDFPTWMTFSFESTTGTNNFSITKEVKRGGLNLGALSKADEVARKVIHGVYDLEEADQALKIIRRQSQDPKHLTTMLSNALGAGSFSLLFGVNLPTALTSFFLGAIIYGVIFIARKSEFVRSTSLALCTFASAVAAILLQQIFPEIEASLAVLSSVIVFVPGLSLVTSLEEATAEQFVSAGAKLFASIITLFKLFFGALLGFTIMSAFFPVDLLSAGGPTQPIIVFLGVIGLGLSLMIPFHVRKKDVFWAILTGVLGFYAAQFSNMAGTLISTFIGTLVIALAARISSNITESPKSVFLITGIIFLVPGSKTYVGLGNALLDTPMLTVPNLGQQITFILMGIIGGLLFSGAFKQKKI